MHLATILAVVLTFVLSLNGPQHPTDFVGIKLLASVLCGLCVVACVASLTRHRVRADLADRTFGLLLLAFVAGVYGPMNFGQIVKNNLQLERYVCIDELAVVLPLVVTLLWSWAQRCESSSTSTRFWKSACNRGRFAMTVARHQLVMPLVPVLLVLSASDVARKVAPNNVSVEAVSVGIALFLLVATTPWLLRFCWRTESFPDGDHRRQLESIFSASELSIRDILVWRTDGRIANAVLAGIFPGCRYLFLTDGLMNQLEQRNLKAIVAHEAGHARHGHLFQLFLSLQVPLFLVLILHQVLDRSEMASDSVRWCGMVTVFFGWLLIHGRIARAFEHQADVAACHILGGTEQLRNDCVTNYGSALTLAAGNATGADWLHPSIATRLSMLRFLSADVVRERRFQRQIKGVRAMLIGGVGMLIVCWIGLL